MGEPEDDNIDWKAKYKEDTAKLQKLETLSKDVLKEYDDLLKQFEELKSENASLSKKVSEKNAEIKTVNEYIDPAIAEYEKLKLKYEIEKGCRHEAEIYASQIHQHNKKLKRQTVDLCSMLSAGGSANFNVVDLKFEDEDKEEKEIENGYQTSLNNTIKELKNEVGHLKASLLSTQNDLEAKTENYKSMSSMYKAAKLKLKQTEKSLRDHKAALKELSTVSEEAYQEYENLQDKFNLEMQKRGFAERKMAELTVDNGKMKRQSAVLLSQVSPGDKLHLALMEIEDLTNKLEEQRKHYDRQISELEEKVDSGSSESMNAKEEETQALEGERDDLISRVKEYEDKYANLETEYDALLKKYEESKRPPPPPPPPPPPAISTTKGFLNKITRKKKKDIEATIRLKGGVVNDDFSKVLEDMMSNIKTGKTLRKTLKPVITGTDEKGHTDVKMVLKSKSFDDIQSEASEPKSDDGHAMKELNNIMKKFKRAHSVSDLEPLEKDQPESELAAVFRKVKKSASVDSDTDIVTRRSKLSQVTEERESEVIEITQM
ncbi:shootin-1-like isoform X2 [Mya arenaria]|uniref:shootin-1-like isoform X2 n=1 Tax=Mya arenaria TaxID=6604 RepID=UPI0022E49886|nr:shootin-1-like isoform X2 [Mya arenaria]